MLHIIKGNWWVLAITHVSQNNFDCLQGILQNFITWWTIVNDAYPGWECHSWVQKTKNSSMKNNRHDVWTKREENIKTILKNSFVEEFALKPNV